MMRLIKLLGLLLTIYAGLTAAWDDAVEAAIFNPDTFTLRNGMQVVVISNHRAPIVTHMVWYKVGSADEPPGKTGVAHFLEHLMFKATKTLQSGEFSKIVARNGGQDNAFTSLDYTGYHQTVAASRLEAVMRIEADRMRNLIIDAKEVEPERQVVREERRSRTDNSPAAKLREQLNATIFLNYPYRNPVIGWDHEIVDLTVDDLRRFYDTYYWPNNAILVVAGDITADVLKPLAEKYYGAIPAGKIPPRIRPQEPPHNAARTVTLSDSRVRQPSWQRAFFAPSRIYGDKQHSYPLEVLSQVFGGGATSRLYRSLVIEQRIALSAGSFYDADKLGPSNFSIFASPRPGVGMDQIERVVAAEIKKLRENGVSQEELTRAKTGLQAEAVYVRDSMGAGARVLGAALSSGQTIADVEAWPDRIGRVTADQIKAAANAVLRQKRAVTGYLLPGQPTPNQPQTNRPQTNKGG